MPPLLFRPVIKQIRWGGRRLGTILGKPIGDASDYAESWEVVDHGDDQSVVDGGQFDGLTLKELVTTHNDALFGRHAGRAQFPLLIKLLDASDRLSVQVHPDDVLAKQHDPDENGKTEAWVIMHAEPGATLYAGLRPGVDEARLRAALQDGSVEETLHAIEVRSGDCVFIPAGTVHAIGEGILLAEVQQSSDLTFRLDDWGRVGSDGKPRQIHIEESLEATDFARGPVGPVTPSPLDGPAARSERLAANDFFVMDRHRTDSASFSLPNDDRFHVLMCLEGEGRLTAGPNAVDLAAGRTVLLPAEREMTSLTGDLTLLDAYLA